jgi:hypothetical protein
MSILEQVQALSAPQRIEDAAKRVDRYLAAELLPPADIVRYIRSWVGSNQGQNRYGK